MALMASGQPISEHPCPSLPSTPSPPNQPRPCDHSPKRFAAGPRLRVRCTPALPAGISAAAPAGRHHPPGPATDPRRFRGTSIRRSLRLRSPRLPCTAAIAAVVYQTRARTAWVAALSDGAAASLPLARAATYTPVRSRCGAAPAPNVPHAASSAARPGSQGRPAPDPSPAVPATCTYEPGPENLGNRRASCHSETDARAADARLPAASRTASASLACQRAPGVSPRAAAAATAVTAAAAEPVLHRVVAAVALVDRLRADERGGVGGDDDALGQRVVHLVSVRVRERAGRERVNTSVVCAMCACVRVCLRESACICRVRRGSWSVAGRLRTGIGAFVG